MAAPLAENDIFLVSMIGEIFGQRTITTFQYRCNVIVGGPHTVQDAYVGIETQLGTGPGTLALKLRACCPMEWSLSQFWIQRIAPERIAKYVSTFQNGPGSGLSTEVTNLQASITRRGELATRASVGGIRVPLSEENCDDGLVAAGHKVVLDALAQQMLLTLAVPGVGQFTPCLYSPPKPPSLIGHLEDLYQTETQPQARVIRTRTVGRGI